MKSNGTLVQFCKSPIPGRVKTRLTPFLSNEQACKTHKQLALYIFNRLLSSPIFKESSDGKEPLKYELWVDQAHDFFKFFSSDLNYKTRIQPCGSLGERLTFAGNSVLEHSNFVIFIGSDCPFISPSDLSEVTRLLGSGKDLVIIPADDGGYVLMAIKKMCNDLFDNIDWGTENVLKQTLKAAETAGLAYHLMDAKPDIDRPEDLALLGTLEGFPVGEDSLSLP